jgi:hypothetical protein
MTKSLRPFALILALQVIACTVKAADDALPPPPPTSKTEAAAVENFARDMQGVKDWIAGETKAAEVSEARFHMIPGKLPAQLAKVRTQGLPSALARPFTALKTNAAAHAAALKDMPAKEEKVAEWLAAKQADPKHNEAIGELIGTGSEIASELIAAGVDYRIGRQVDINNISHIEDRWIVILSVYKNFHQAKADAGRIAKASGVPFSMNGMIYDKKGLRFPDNYEDEVFAGTYVARRFNGTEVNGNAVEQNISIEKSDDYQGFASGYYIVVGCIAESADEGKAQAAKYKKHAPGTYVKKTELYLGCMH